MVFSDATDHFTRVLMPDGLTTFTRYSLRVPLFGAILYHFSELTLFGLS